jgi:cytochrome b6-f complex iron-sulfur subunit
MNNKEQISRHEFLKDLGLKGAALMAVYCGATAVSACSTTQEVVPLGSDVMLDLAAASNAALKTVGGYVVLQSNNVVVANTSGGYVAVTLICSHENLKKMTYKSGEFYCTEHGARFDNTGKGLNTEAKKGLTVYKTTLSGNTLTVKAS